MSREYDFRRKFIRDPLYGFMGFSKEEIRLIDTEAFSRLRRIKQLSHAYVVYPSAVHTRFEHSLGAAYIAGRMCDELQFDQEQKRLVRMAVLLHDIGHGPFSHLFEEVLQWVNHSMQDIHEYISRLIIQNDAEIGDILGDDRDAVIGLLGGGDAGEMPILSQIVSGGLDADKLDYLRRDSHHIGAAYGHFDLERILYTLRRTPGPEPLLAVDAKGRDALENYRIARYLMYAQVYEHHAHLAADRMFLQAVHTAIYDEKIISTSNLRIDRPEQLLSFYKTLDDDSIYDMIMNDPRADLSKTILERIRRRKLLKRVSQFGEQDILDPGLQEGLTKMSREDLDAVAAKTASDLGLEREDVILHRSDVKIKLYSKTDILILDGNQVHDMKEVSPISAQSRLVRFYIFGPNDKSLHKGIAQNIAEQLGIRSEAVESF